MRIKVRNKKELFISLELLIICFIAMVFIVIYNHTNKTECEACGDVAVIVETVSADVDPSVVVQVSNDEIKEDSSSTDIKENKKDKENYSLPVNIIYQYPNMPSGCEITSLTMVLNYLGFDVTNTYMADNYLPSDTYDMDLSFVGSVYNNNSFGCFAPVITKAANDYFKSIGSSSKAINVSGSSREKLLSYVKAGTPIIIWNTEGMAESYIEHYDFNGTDFVWYGNEHCVVLCGYNEEDNTVAVADSISGYVYRDADTFFERYRFIKSQAVYIQK